MITKYFITFSMIIGYCKNVLYSVYALGPKEAFCKSSKSVSRGERVLL